MDFFSLHGVLKISESTLTPYANNFQLNPLKKTYVFMIDVQTKIGYSKTVNKY